MRIRQLHVDVDEGQSGTVNFTLVDSAGVAIPKADIETLTLTLTDLACGDVINERDEQDVLDANGVDVGDTDGSVSWAYDAEDTPYMGDDDDLAPQEETHLAHFRVTWSGGTLSKQVLMKVRNIPSFSVSE